MIVGPITVKVKNISSKELCLFDFLPGFVLLPGKEVVTPYVDAVSKSLYNGSLNKFQRYGYVSVILQGAGDAGNVCFSIPPAELPDGERTIFHIPNYTTKRFVGKIAVFVGHILQIEGNTPQEGAYKELQTKDGVEFFSPPPAGTVIRFNYTEKDKE